MKIILEERSPAGGLEGTAKLSYCWKPEEKEK